MRIKILQVSSYYTVLREKTGRLQTGLYFAQDGYRFGTLFTLQSAYVNQLTDTVTLNTYDRQYTRDS